MGWQLVSPKVDRLRTQAARAQGRGILRMLPRYHGWRAKKYGPFHRHTVRRMPLLYWRLESRVMFWWVRRYR